MKTENQASEETTLRTFMAIFCADIDIFLLQDEAKENDKDKLYSKEEIREQLHKSFHKFTHLPNVQSALFDTPLFPSLSESMLRNMGFSEKEIKQAEKTNKEQY
jgi:hypothetical protein